MFQTDLPIVKDIVLVGGGHSHVLVLKHFAMQKLAGLRITLISRELQSPYSGMLPGYIAGHYSFDETHIDLLPLSRFAGARFFHDEVIGLDPENKYVLCKNRPPLSYDVLSIDIGSIPLTSFASSANNVIPVKPIDGFLKDWQPLFDRIKCRNEKVSIGVVGAGAAGVELVLSIQYHLQNEFEKLARDKNQLEFHLFTEADDILVTYNSKVRKKFRRVLKERRIEFHPGHKVVEVADGKLRCENDALFKLDEVFWATTAAAQKWPGDAGLDINEQGFIKVNDTLESISHPGIFAAGDIAHVVNHLRPKAGVFAVRQGPALFNNLRKKLKGQPLQKFTPQKQFLSLISTGHQYAIASRNWWAFEGRYIWRWKDWIDRRFMQKFTDLPEMHSTSPNQEDHSLFSTKELAELPERTMRCGGCGGKVGANILAETLSQLQPQSRTDVLIGLAQPDDAAVVSIPADNLVVQTIDFFRSFVDDPYIFGQIAAHHALNDIYAMGATPQTALAIVSLAEGLEQKVREELLQMMQGAVKVLNAADTALVGGHTSEAKELSLGFSINGFINREQVLAKQGMQAGDKLIITKALGTGALFAADMRNKVKGIWINKAIESMLQSNLAAARCFIEHGANACTDISGFGLLGHLLEMIDTSVVNVELELENLPVLDGAIDCIKAGIVSSLHEANRRVETKLNNSNSFIEHPFYNVLFDPQTSGGLLASVPSAQADHCVKTLTDLGYVQSAIIGSVVKTSDEHIPVSLK